jgi:hypothetical protein
LTDLFCPRTIENSGCITHRTSDPRGETPTAYIPLRSRRIVFSVPITDDDIRRFQAIWREEFEEDITADEARAHIGRLDALYLMLLRPLPKPSESEDTQTQ